MFSSDSSNIDIRSADQTRRFHPGRMLYTCAGRIIYCDCKQAIDAKVFYAIDGHMYCTHTDAGGFFLIRAHSGANITISVKAKAKESVSPAQYTLDCVREDQRDLHFCITQA